MDLSALDQLLAWCRSNGVVQARVGDLAITLGEQPGAEDPATPFSTYLREQGEKGKHKVYERVEDDPELYGRTPPELDE